MRTRSLGLCAASLLLLGTAACGGVQPDSVGATPSTTVSPSASGAASSDGTTPTGGTQTDAAAAEQGGFGTPIEWEGLTVTLAQPKEFSPSAFASYPPGSERFVEVDVTVQNTSDQPLETMFFAIVPTGKTLADKVADSDKNIGTPTTAIAPGQSLTWKEAYPMNESLSLDVQWAPPSGEEKTTTLTLQNYPTPAPTGTATGTATGTESGTASGEAATATAAPTE